MRMMISDQLEAIERGDPPLKEAGIFGLPYSTEQSALVLIPVPWDATASYGLGASTGPKSILEASHQLDLEDSCFGRFYSEGISLLPENLSIKKWNKQAYDYVKDLRSTTCKNKKVKQAKVNAFSKNINDYVYQTAYSLLNQEKKVGLIGGDHSSPFGLIQALGEFYEDFGILHIDAHHDLRKAYEGFKHSHASIMYNTMQEVPQVTKLVQVGIRDYCKPETDYIKEQSRVSVFYDRDLFRWKALGESFQSIVDEIISNLPKNIYVSFDIDGLSPQFCPNTGTPVPGGLSFNEACYLLERLKETERQVVGFDLCEVCRAKDNSQWDENVGSRILYKLCGTVLTKNF